MYLRSGTLLHGGKYRIVRFIASGGFGCTYEAVHLMLDKKVAIKEFFPKVFCNRDTDTSNISIGLSQKPLVSKLKEKFVNEARSIAKLSHPGIVKVTDVFEENSTAYYVMDYIEGKSLGDIVNEHGRLSEDAALGYIRQVCEALAYVHSKNRLHLDIKPGNIMIDDTDRAILIDFGASKQYDEENGENTSTLIGKTPGYAPIEQMGNDVGHFRPATDIYSIGATLYKCLSGKTPLQASLLVQGEELDPLPTNVTAASKNAIEAAMKINPKKRPQSIEEFLRILDDRKAESNIYEGTIYDGNGHSGSSVANSNSGYQAPNYKKPKGESSFADSAQEKFPVSPQPSSTKKEHQPSPIDLEEEVTPEPFEPENKIQTIVKGLEPQKSNNQVELDLVPVEDETPEKGLIDIERNQSPIIGNLEEKEAVSNNESGSNKVSSNQAVELKETTIEAEKHASDQENEIKGVEEKRLSESDLPKQDEANAEQSTKNDASAEQKSNSVKQDEYISYSSKAETASKPPRIDSLNTSLAQNIANVSLASEKEPFETNQQPEAEASRKDVVKENYKSDQVASSQNVSAKEELPVDSKVSKEASKVEKVRKVSQSTEAETKKIIVEPQHKSDNRPSKRIPVMEYCGLGRPSSSVNKPEEKEPNPETLSSKLEPSVNVSLSDKVAPEVSSVNQNLQSESSSSNKKSEEKKSEEKNRVGEELVSDSTAPKLASTESNLKSEETTSRNVSLKDTPQLSLNDTPQLKDIRQLKETPQQLKETPQFKETVSQTSKSTPVQENPLQGNPSESETPKKEEPKSTFKGYKESSNSNPLGNASETSSSHNTPTTDNQVYDYDDDEEEKSSKSKVFIGIAAAVIIAIICWFAFGGNKSDSSLTNEDAEDIALVEDSIDAPVVTEVANVPTLTLTIPKNVKVGEEFKIVFRLSQGTGSSFKIKDIKGCTKISGPTEEKTKKGMEYSIIYKADKEGTYTIPSASIKVNGNSVTSKSQKITVRAEVEENDQANEEAVIANEEPQEVPAVTKGVIKGHEWVDLGLPSGLKWATSNVGASSPEKYGSYYAWGETKSKSSFDDDNCESIDKDGEWLSNNGYIAGSGNLILSHDVARQNWGGSWRMPTLNDFRELKSNTTSEWTTFNGVHGRLFKSKKNGNSIFLPAAGWRLGPSPYSSGSVGYYLSSTPYEGQIFGCYYMDFDWGTCDISWGKRQSGRSVRPVSN